jgi:hypothetical protein
LVKRRGWGGAELFLCGEGTTVRGRRSVVHGEDDATDRWGRSASEGKRARERGSRVGLACQRERVRGACGRFRARAGQLMGQGGGNARVCGRRGGRDMGQNWPSRGELFSFFFLLLITHFIFVSFSFCTKLFSGYSRCWKIKSK